MKPICSACILLLLSTSASAQVERVWLTHRTNQPSRIVVNWTTKMPGDSVVRFGTTTDYGQEVRVPGSRTLHHVEIPRTEQGAIYHYSARSGDQSSPDAMLKAYPNDVLRVAVVANWQGRPNLSAILKDDPHLLLTAGDNIRGIWQKCGTGNADCVAPYADLIDAYPELFRSTPVMPALGNHDREIRPRGDHPPAEPVYDIDARAFRRFFELPHEEWKWRFDVPDFGARFVALDFNHISDHGTTWQSCHDFDRDSEQFRWYERLMDDRSPDFVLTLYNERNARIRKQASGGWHELFRKGTVCITGFGHFGEQAELDGLLYFNTSLQGRGNQYPDPHSRVVKGEDNYLLLTFDRAERTMAIEMKNLDGAVLDRVQVHGQREVGGVRRRS